MAKRIRLERKAGHKKPRQVILIIGEGQTEEAYFRSVKRHFRSAALHIEIERADCKSDPVHIAGKALRKKPGDYDAIFCVFDGDKPGQAAKARQQLARHKAIRGFVSMPCFEVWLTLHFGRSDASMPDCQQAEDRLKRHWETYTKGCECDGLMPHLGVACDNARWLEQQQHANPCTDLHYLIEVLETALKET